MYGAKYAGGTVPSRDLRNRRHLAAFPHYSCWSVPRKAAVGSSSPAGRRRRLRRPRGPPDASRVASRASCARFEPLWGAGAAGMWRCEAVFGLRRSDLGANPLSFLVTTARRPSRTRPRATRAMTAARRSCRQGGRARRATRRRAASTTSTPRARPSGCRPCSRRPSVRSNSAAGRGLITM